MFLQLFLPERYYRKFVCRLSAEPALGRGERGPFPGPRACAGPRAWEPLCGTAAFLLSSFHVTARTAKFCSSPVTYCKMEDVQVLRYCFTELKAQLYMVYSRYSRGNDVIPSRWSCWTIYLCSSMWTGTIEQFSHSVNRKWRCTVTKLRRRYWLICCCQVPQSATVNAGLNLSAPVVDNKHGQPFGLNSLDLETRRRHETMKSFVQCPLSVMGIWGKFAASFGHAK